MLYNIFNQSYYMSFFKGCLIFIIVVFTIFTCGAYFYFNNLNKEYKSEYDNIKIQLAELSSKIKVRNNYILKSRFKDDVKRLAKVSDSIISINNFTDTLIWTEYQINELTYKNDSLISLNNELNIINNKYNFQLKTFKQKWIMVPYSLVRIYNKYPKNNYFDIIYGESNIDKIKRKKDIEYWIETGEWK